MNIHPALKPLCVPIERLTLDHANARAHPKKNLDALRESLRLFGQRTPIVYHRDTGRVLKGNGLVIVAREMGAEEVAAIPSDDDHATASAYALADNRTAELSEWIPGILRETVDELLPLADDIDLDALGLSSTEIDRILAEQDISEEDANTTTGKKDRGGTDDTADFSIVFDDEEQENIWYDFIARLRQMYPEAGTTGARLVAFISQHLPQ